MSALRQGLAAFGLAGALAFSSALIISLLNPGFVEQTAKQLIRAQIEKSVREKVEAIDNEFISKRAERFVKGYATEIAAVKKHLADGLPERMASVIAEMQNLDCECRKKVEQGIRGGFEWKVSIASQSSERLTTLIRTKYMETAEKITREFRIFTGTNAAVFVLLIMALFFKKQAGVHLVPPAIVLLIAGGLTACLYLFNQNWLHTIVFNDYVGFTYVAYLSVVFFFLCDILFNRARVTTELLNQLLNAIGSATVVAPC